MTYHHLRLNIHDVSLYLIAIIMFAILIGIIFCVYRCVDNAITTSGRSTARSSRKNSFYLLEHAQPHVHTAGFIHQGGGLGVEGVKSIDPELASIPSLSDREKEILQIHCEECERLSQCTGTSMTLDSSGLSCTSTMRAASSNGSRSTLV